MRISLVCIMMAGGLLGALPGVLHAQPTEVPIHDPVMAEQDGTYYVFGTGEGVAVWSSDDMEHWRREAPVFEETPAWVFDMLPGFDGVMWAPDIYEHDGTYYLYYSVSAFGRNNSAIGVATNETLDAQDPRFEWVDQGIVVRSVPGRNLWNAIDANVTHDADGTPWMAFGSHWGGIKLTRLAEDLTQVAQAPGEREWHTVAARHRYWKLDERDAGDSANPELSYDSLYTEEILEANRNSESGAVEAPFLFRKNGYYYLFVSWDRCCRGAESTYKIVVGRSRDITGPYLDREGEEMTQGGGSLVVRGMTQNDRWAALGHSAAYTMDGTDYLLFHAYDTTDDGASKLMIEEIEWDVDQWPIVTVEAD